MSKHTITLKEFLTKFTSIPIRFIDEYMEFHDMGEKSAFGINLESVIKFLRVQKKDRFYENFRNKFKEYIDYTTINVGGKRTKDVKAVEYYISFDVFERICLDTHTEKGDEVRDYFRSLGKFINYYKQNISDMILENVASGKFEYMYILLVNKGKNIFKPGRTEEFRKRMNGYATGKDVHPDIKFIMLVKDAKLVEKCYGIFLEKYRYKGRKELYKVDIDVIRTAIVGCAETDRNFMN